MDDTSKYGQSISRKTPEDIRAERIAAISDPKLRQQLDGMVKARDAKLDQVRDKQRETYTDRVEELRDLKIKTANAPQFTPPGYRSPYLGNDGHALAESHAKAQIQRNDIQYLKNVAREHNEQIDKRLDANRENQPERTPTERQPSALEQQREPSARSSPKPNRYAALIESQKYAERAANEAAQSREKEPERQQKRERGLER